MNILLPFRGLESAKSRWSGLGFKREDLALRMLQQTVDVVARVVGAEQTVLVSPDPALKPLFHQYRILQTAGRGLNQDLFEARSQLDSSPLAVILPDLPTLTSEDVASLVEASRSYDVVLCPDHHEVGTNAIALQQPESLDFLFEGASFERFYKACQKAARSVAVLRRPGLAHDCDDVEALKRFCLL